MIDIIDRCKCDHWRTQIDQLDSLAVFASVHGWQYHGAPFVYCPWCGNELSDQETDDKIDREIASKTPEQLNAEFDSWIAEYQ